MQNKISSVGGLKIVRRRSKTASILRNISVLLFALIFGAGLYMYFRPLPTPQVVSTLEKPAAPLSPSLSWPAVGSAALSADGYDFVASNDDIHTVLPTASLMKLLTVLCVLEKYPLKDGEQGPTLTMTAEDVARYKWEEAHQGNHIRIVEGEQMSLYHTLEAVLIQSSNSTADTVAVWAFGSMKQYTDYAAEYLKRNDLTSTKTGDDAAGSQLADTSTLSDLIKLAKLARKNPVIMKILGTQSATFQTHGTIYNRNRLGNAVLLGGKTGSIDDIKGSYLFMATTKNIISEGKDIPIVGVIAYDASVQQAIRDSEALAKSAASCFETLTLVHAGDVVGYETTAWGSKTPIVATKDLSLERWCGSELGVKLSAVPGNNENNMLSATADGVTVSVPVQAKGTIPEPSLWWRLTSLR